MSKYIEPILFIFGKHLLFSNTLWNVANNKTIICLNTKYRLCNIIITIACRSLGGKLSKHRDNINMKAYIFEAVWPLSQIQTQETIRFGNRHTNYTTK